MRPARNNPFRSEAVDALPYHPADQVSSLYSLLKVCTFRGQIVGPKGTGKTTLVRDLISAFPKDQTLYSIRLSEDAPTFTRQQWKDLTAQPENCVVFIDGIEQVKARHRKKLIKKSKKWQGLVVTSHFNLRKHEKNLPVLCLTGPSVDDFIHLAQCLDPGQQRKHLEILYTLHQGNIRQAFRHLYDQWASDTDDGSGSQGL